MILAIGMFMDVLIFTIGFILGDLYIQYFSTIILYFLIVIFYTKKIKENVVLWAFLVSFGMFMFARILIRPIITGEWLWTKFTDELAQHTFLSLVIALVSIIVGNITSNYKLKAYNSKWDYFTNSKPTDEFLTVYLEKVASILFFVTIPFKLLYAVYTINFVRATTYSTQYLVGGSYYMPGWLDSLSRVHTILFLIFLASLPSKRKTYFYFIVEISTIAISLFGGNRFEFMCVSMLLFVYVWFREKNEEEEKWINARLIRVTILSVLGLMVMLQSVGIARGNQSATITNNYLLGFLDSMGYSVEIIPLGKKHQLHFFGDNVLYFWGPLRRIFQSFTGIGTLYSGQTVENAKYGYQFGGTLTYLESSWLYTVTGGGLGSSYIAELYHSFGYTGIAVFNLILGRMINKLEFKSSSNWLVRTIVLLILYNLFKMPRFNCWIWMEDIISKVTILTIMGTYLISMFVFQTNKSLFSRPTKRGIH